MTLTSGAGDAASVELDETDKAIIRELQDDGRLPYAKLGPRVGLSQAATRQRVNRLIARGVMQVVAVTDPVALGLSHQAMVNIRVDGDARTVAGALAEVTEVEYVVLVAGRWDVIVEVVCRSAEAFLTVPNDRIRTVEGVAEVEVLSYLRLVKQSYDWGTG